MDAVTLRRKIHQNPELSFKEEKTSATISEALTQAGISHRAVAGNGIIATIEGRNNHSRAVVLRADIDALPIEEQTGLEFASHCSGVMHACGHDIHAAILFGALKRLQEDREFCGSIIGIFQPGEELLPGGASKVLEEKPFEGYLVEGVITQHVEPELEVGEVGFKKGRYMAACDELRFTTEGEGGHAALRSKITDTVGSASSLVSSLLELNDKEVVLSIGRIIAEGATNIIPNRVEMEGTLRTFDPTERYAVRKEIEARARANDQRWGTTTAINITDGYPSVINDVKLTELSRTVAHDKQALKVVDLGLRPTAEDFGYYTQLYPSVLYRLGVGRESGRLHTSTFNPDERAIEVGINLMCEIAKELLR